jgi:hypothetical protein
MTPSFRRASLLIDRERRGWRPARRRAGANARCRGGYRLPPRTSLVIRALWYLCGLTGLSVSLATSHPLKSDRETSGTEGGRDHDAEVRCHRPDGAAFDKSKQPRGTAAATRGHQRSSPPSGRKQLTGPGTSQCARVYVASPPRSAAEILSGG